MLTLGERVPSFRLARGGRPGQILWVAAAALALCLPALIACKPAIAFSQRGHSFAFSFPSAGSSEEELKQPSAVTVDQRTGEVFVADYGHNRVDVFEPVLNGQGALTGEHLARTIPVLAPTAVAVDDTTEGSDPSRGDIYVVGSSKHELKEEEPNKRVFKFSPTGEEILLIRKFKEPVEKGEEPEEAEELEEVQGLAVNAAGDLYVYGSGAVDVYTSAAKNKSLLSIAAPLTATRGLALDSAGDMYVGHESENPEDAGPEGPALVIAKLEAETGATLSPELERQPSDGVAVNTEDVPANGVDEQNDVYVANPGGAAAAGSSIAELSPTGTLIQRFTTSGLNEPSGVAVYDHTGAVLVTDAASNQVDVFELEEAGPATIDRLTAHVLPSGSTSPANAAQVELTVDPAGRATHYSLEYGPAACNHSPDPCSTSREGEIGPSFESTALTLELSGLTPGVYHYRLTAGNGDGPVASSEQTFTVLTPSSGLPDGRASSWCRRRKGRCSDRSAQPGRRVRPRRRRRRRAHVRRERRDQRRSGGQPQLRTPAGAGVRGPELEPAGHRDADEGPSVPTSARPSTSSSHPTCRSRWWNRTTRTGAGVRSRRQGRLPARQAPITPEAAEQESYEQAQDDRWARASWRSCASRPPPKRPAGERELPRRNTRSAPRGARSARP